MKERIIDFLKAENKSSAQMAEEIGVQPSGISHILSGRNNPSLDFVLKMLEKYKYLSPEWLLFGKGTMFRDEQMQTLFSESINHVKHENVFNPVVDSGTHIIDNQNIIQKNDIAESTISEKKDESKVIKIVWFYNNNRFEEYYPKS